MTEGPYFDQTLNPEPLNVYSAWDGEGRRGCRKCWMAFVMKQPRIRFDWAQRTRKTPVLPHHKREAEPSNHMQNLHHGSVCNDPENSVEPSGVGARSHRTSHGCSITASYLLTGHLLLQGSTCGGQLAGQRPGCCGFRCGAWFRGG